MEIWCSSRTQSKVVSIGRNVVQTYDLHGSYLSSTQKFKAWWQVSQTLDYRFPYTQAEAYLDQEDRNCNGVEEYASYLTNESLSKSQNSSTAGTPEKTPFMNPDSSNRLSHQPTPDVDFESQVRSHSILQNYDNQHMPPANFPDESEINFAPEQYKDLQLFYQTYCDTRAGNPGFATEAVLITTHCGLSQEVEQPLTNPSHSAPEAETLIGDCPSALFADLVEDAIPPEGFYAHCTESQAGAVTSLDPGHPSPSQSATFPTSQFQNSFQRGHKVRVSDDLLPQQCLSQAQVSEQPIWELQSRQVSVCVSPAKRDVLADPVLTSGIQLDSDSDEVKQREGVGEGFYSLLQEQPPPDPEPSSLLRGNDYLVTSINSDKGFAQVDGGVNDALQLVRTSLHMGPSHYAPLSGASFTGLPSSVEQAPPAEDAHEMLQQDCVLRVEAAAPSSAKANGIYSDTGDRPLKYQEMDCNRISQPQTYLTHLQGTQNFPSTPELELPVLSTSNIIREVHSEIPHQARPDPDSNLTSPKSESSLPETFIHDESDSDSAEGTIVVEARPGQDKQNAPTLPVDKHIDGFDDTYKDNEEKARGSNPSVAYKNQEYSIDSVGNDSNESPFAPQYSSITRPTQEMTSADRDLPNGLSIHTFTEADFASQWLSENITEDYDDQERAPVSVTSDYEDPSAPNQYTEQPMPHSSHNICNDVSQRESGSPTTKDIDNYPFKCGQLGCGFASNDEAYQHDHQKDCKLGLKIWNWRKSMAENWTTEELDNRRRIVLFHRKPMGSHKESKVEAICRPVGTKQRIMNCICISCIWWDERGECYVTSVDIIRLLEQLFVPSNCFSAKEKALIHRELDKLHPQIVYKTKPDTQEFFKTIMGFPDPKPFSLGEDVKVFQCENLDSALENIIRSYTVLSGLTAPAPDAGSSQQEPAILGTNDSLQFYTIPASPQQAYPAIERGSPDVADKTNLIPTGYQQSQELEQLLPTPLCFAPGIETLTDDYRNTYYVTPLHDLTLPEGFYARQEGRQLVQHYIASQFAMPLESIHSGYSQPTFIPVPQHDSLYLSSPQAGVSDELLPEKRASQARDSKQPMEELQPRRERHWRTHTGERPYKCTWTSCDKHYSRPDHVTRHAKRCHHKPAALVTNDGVSEDSYSFSQESTPLDPGRCSLSTGSILIDDRDADLDQKARGNDYPGTSAECDYGHANVEESTNDTPQPVRTSIISANARTNTNYQLSELTLPDLNKVVLNIAGDLTSMGENWSTDDKANIRRIVHFYKTLTGSTLNATCKLVNSHSQSEDGQCISCIWWAKKGECYVTGVHIINLLEYLTTAPQKLTRIDKYRIRDWLKMFEPSTVSKESTGNQDFYNIIMKCPDLKPRNSDKQGFKVYPWKKLESALKTIVGKPRFRLDSTTELQALGISNIDSKSPSKFPHRERFAPDSNPISPKSESSLHETFIHDESDSDSAESTIVVEVRLGQDKQNAPTLPVDKHIDGFDDTYKDNEEKARGSKPSVTYDDDDWGYAIADGKITIHCKNTLLTSFDREVPVRGMCPGVQRILDRIHELCLRGDIKQQQEGEAESEQIRIKGRTRAMTQPNMSFSENTEQQQSSEETFATIDEMQKMLPESKGLNLSRISKSELRDILKAVQEVLNTIRQELIKSWTEEAEPAKQLLEEFQSYYTSK
ncbi:hypothetical protein FANTH_14179 [Fusarium anthophilum]|uniref:C2H2-type domain-containing protein n=1 Tax=Fusarium anthophilum TaxID=48485 RepID=A0A8H5DMZ7_9HYPO|nr:hypothetical protein FANTH_14179 [Fusarium anthophilum]